ncbi:L-threonylcarbamoyladenylate synthase [Psychroflexus sediminis]|uniref:Threonylcarbamoyl-AMP synthase n=1 Tax=Psychroflexus sediminis TaxID=470826 RepID=A0A1G7V8X2_9FLAO|nr:L-threonylcarbamoyladenylate synthase [Psychroflexus sediminis]SDG55981.1 translation factor SUA5 [Psychroflexus sediminis]
MSIISNDIQKAISLLNQEEVVAIPTETVYGLAGNIYSEKAIRKIFDVKQRPLFNPLIVHVHAVDQLGALVSEFPEKARLLADAFWPGPLTLILKKKPTVPDLITGGKNSVAVRIPRHPVTLELLRQLDFPLAAPSANPFNRISPTSSSHVEAYFKDRLKLVLEGGECQAGIESTIIGFEDGEPVLYRLGSIAVEEIEEVVGPLSIRNKKEHAPEAPGMLAKHYAPQTKTLLVEDIDSFLQNTDYARIGVISFSEKIKSLAGERVQVLSPAGDLKEAASNLYSALHKLDSLGLDIIVAQRFPEEGLGKSINDRLERATSS